MDLKSTYNKIAEDWVKDHEKDDWWQESTHAFLSLLPKGATILDVGCGGGIKTRYIAEKGFQVTGIDFSEKMIEIARRGFADFTDHTGQPVRVDFDVVDLFELDSYAPKFDAIFAQAVLLHVPKAQVLDVLKSMKRHLNPHGLLYIGVKRVKSDGLEEKTIQENDYGYEYERFFSFFTLDELKKYLQELDMELVQEFTTGSGRAEWIQVVGRCR